MSRKLFIPIIIGVIVSVVGGILVHHYTRQPERALYKQIVKQVIGECSELENQYKNLIKYKNQLPHFSNHLIEQVLNNQALVSQYASPGEQEGFSRFYRLEEEYNKALQGVVIAIKTSEKIGFDISPVTMKSVAVYLNHLCFVCDRLGGETFQENCDELIQFEEN